ncbi:MAG: glutamate racemase [Flavobacteriales bacterium]|nr:glutamate racemase [Flavobacteriales bacterium]MCB9166725.1 glutamate racemase [Flavobacteriales bacterium]
MPRNERPIGIFDSGIGGLTVAVAIRRALPGERLLYFGDTAHFPYGEKSAEAIKHYAIRIANFLLDRSCKAVVIACNTASAHATSEVDLTAGERVPVFNVIDPIAEHVARHWKGRRVGVIGTKGTIGSRIYVRAIGRLAPSVKVRSLATPLLAPMIEEGFYKNAISRAVIRGYLEHRNLAGIEALVLGCTHYPLIRKEVEEVAGEKVAVLDPPTIVARHIEQQLTGLGLLHEADAPAGPDHFFLSDVSESFAKSAGRFFRHKLRVEELRLWEER